MASLLKKVKNAGLQVANTGVKVGASVVGTVKDKVKGDDGEGGDNTRGFDHAAEASGLVQREIFHHFVDPSVGRMDAGAFLRFLNECQGESTARSLVGQQPLTLQDAQSIMDATGNSGPWSLFDFQRFLHSEANGVLNPLHTTRVVDDMNRPLHHYFINSSHNTYLTGDQLQSDSSPEMYKKVLLVGCRCVEVDCWDGDDGEPVVYHGYTRTSKIPFLSVVQAIKETAFVTSPYPVILSLEVHTSEAQSDKMATMIRHVFGESLYTHVEAEADGFSRLTPEGLKNKILIKWKLTDSADGDDLKEDMAKKQEGGKPAGAGANGALGRTVLIAAMKTKDWGNDAKVYNIQSTSEGGVEKFLSSEESKDNFRKMNCRMISRVYPAGSRVDSSNYMPQPSWEAGAQMVALNFQTWDEPRRINYGKFARNARCGYILKPHWLTDQAASAGAGAVWTHKHLTVTVFYGVNLPLPSRDQFNEGDKVNPYLKVRLTGMTAASSTSSSSEREFKTKHISDSGACACWNETFTFSDIEHWELGLLTFKAKHKDPLITEDCAEITIPLTSLRSGFRAVHLNSVHQGDQRVPGAVVVCRFDLH